MSIECSSNFDIYFAFSNFVSLNFGYDKTLTNSSLQGSSITIRSSLFFFAFVRGRVEISSNISQSSQILVSRTKTGEINITKTPRFYLSTANFPMVVYPKKSVRFSFGEGLKLLYRPDRTFF